MNAWRPSQSCQPVRRTRETLPLKATDSDKPVSCDEEEDRFFQYPRKHDDVSKPGEEFIIFAAAAVVLLLLWGAPRLFHL